MQKRKFGDRKDGRRVRDITGMNQILLDLKPDRSLGEVYINQNIDVTNLIKYFEKYKKGLSEDEKVTLFHLFATAIAKTIYNRPKLNRFVANRHLYEHNDVVISFVAKLSFTDKSEEVMVLIPVEPSDTLKDISEKIRNKVDDLRAKDEATEMAKGANNAILILGKLPNIIRVPIVGLFKWTDKKGLLPSSLVEDNLYYSSMIISNLGNLKCGGIYHNLTDFGTCSGLITIGEVKKQVVDGKEKYFCEFGVTIDERIADGFYFVKSIHLIKKIMENPELLEDRADAKIEID